MPKTYKKDCLICGAKESVVITVGDVTVEGFTVTVAPCTTCGHIAEWEDYMPPYSPFKKKKDD